MECPLVSWSQLSFLLYSLPALCIPILVAGGMGWGAEKAVLLSVSVSATQLWLKHPWVIKAVSSTNWKHGSVPTTVKVITQPKPAQRGEQCHPPCAAAQPLWAHAPHVKSAAGHFPGWLNFLSFHCTCMCGTKDFHHHYMDSKASQHLGKKVFPHSWW